MPSVSFNSIRLGLLRPGIAITLAAAILLTFLNTAFAGGFQISETSVTGVGRAFAGSGISGDGPSDMFHNPAGLVLNKGAQIEIARYRIQTNVRFKNISSSIITSTGNTATSGAVSEDANLDEGWFNLYYADEIAPNTRFGLGFSSPFGMSVEYPASWVGRYQAIKTELQSIEFNPAVAFQANDFFSIGAGLALVKADIEIQRALYNAGSPDDLLKVTGDDSGLGFTAGVMLGNESTRIGLSYRSAIDLELKGPRDIITPSSTTRLAATTDLTLPATAYFSWFNQLSSNLEMLFTARWTDWSEFEELRISFADGSQDIQPHRWDDSYTYGVGFNYYHSNRLTYRIGYAFDETPIDRKSSVRTASIPDFNRNWLTFGASYKSSRKLRFDVTYAYVFYKDETISESTALPGSAPAASSNLNGAYEKSNGQMLSLQVHYGLN